MALKVKSTIIEEIEEKDTKESQLSFFELAPSPIVEKIKALDLMNITPSQAFVILEELKKAVQ